MAWPHGRVFTASRRRPRRDLIDTYGRVTRAEVAKLCLMSSPEARLLLTRLRDEGKIEMHGAKRGVHYVKPSPPGRPKE